MLLVINLSAKNCFEKLKNFWRLVDNCETVGFLFFYTEDFLISFGVISREASFLSSNRLPAIPIMQDYTKFLVIIPAYI